MSKRVHCLVPYCHRTTGRRTGEWICAVHWRAVPRSWRRRLSLFGRRYRRLCGKGGGHWQFPPGSEGRLTGVKLERLFLKMWDRCKKVAIEAAGGIG